MSDATAGRPLDCAAGGDATDHDHPDQLQRIAEQEVALAERHALEQPGEHRPTDGGDEPGDREGGELGARR